MTQVRPMIAGPQPRPTVSWKNLMIASLTSISGWRTLAITNMSVAVAVHRARVEQRLTIHRIEAAVAQRVAANQAPPDEYEAAQHPVGPDGLDGVGGAGRIVPAARRYQRGYDPPVEGYGRGENPAHAAFSSARPAPRRSSRRDSSTACSPRSASSAAA